MTGIDLKSFLSLLPQTVLLVWASLLLLVDLFIPKNKKAWTAILAGLGLINFSDPGFARMGTPVTYITIIWRLWIILQFI